MSSRPSVSFKMPNTLHTTSTHMQTLLLCCCSSRFSIYRSVKAFFLPFFCLLPSCHSFVQGETLAPLAAPHPSREISTQKNSFTQRRMGEQSRYCAPPKTKVWLLSTQEDNSAFWQKVRVALKHVFYETWTSLEAMRRCSQVAPIQSRLASCPVAPFIFLLLPFLVNITCWLALCNTTVLWNPAKSLPGG